MTSDVAVGEVLYVRGDEHDSSHEFVWDDEPFNKAYDRAMFLTKCQVDRRYGMEIETVSTATTHQNSSPHKKRKSKKKKKKDWHVGSLCRTMYSEDFEEYEAIVTKMSSDRKTCIVKFIGYENDEEVPVSDLKQSHGNEARRLQILAAKHGSNVVTEEENAQSTNNNSPKNPAKAVNCSPGSSRNRMDWEPLPPINHHKTFQGCPSAIIPNGLPTGGEIPVPVPPPPHLFQTDQNEDNALSSMLIAWYMSGYHTGYYHGLKNGKEKSECVNKNSKSKNKRK